LTSALNVTEIINAIQAYNDTIASSKWLVQPTMILRSETSSLENADEVIRNYFICDSRLYNVKAT
jgi:nuclear cap-binding protein subunit 1